MPIRARSCVKTGTGSKLLELEGLEQIRSASKSPKVAVVVLTLNGRKWLGPCLESVLASDYPGLMVCLVDNGSSDGSQEMVEVAEADPKIGLLSPMHWDYDGEGLDPFFERLIFEETSYFDGGRADEADKPLETKRLIGAAMMMSRSLCEEVGLFDPLYFKHHEETDLCRRARFHGFRVVAVTGSRIFHHNRRAHEDGREKAPFLNVRNIPLYNWKNPERSIWKKTRAYLGFGINFPEITGWPLSLTHGLKVAYIQLWILLHLPVILLNTRKERCGPCYIDVTRP